MKLEWRSPRGLCASWLVAICVGLTATTSTPTTTAASVPCHPGCHLEGGYCGPGGDCRCRPGWTGALCDTRRPRSLSSIPAPGAKRCNKDTTTTTTVAGGQPPCPPHGSPCPAGSPGESACLPLGDPCYTPSSAREVTTAGTRGCERPRVSSLSKATSQTPIPHRARPPQQPTQQPRQQNQLLLLQQPQQPQPQHPQQHQHRHQNDPQFQHPRSEQQAAQRHLKPPPPGISVGPPAGPLRRREALARRGPSAAGFEPRSGAGSMSDWQRRWACVGALASFTSLVLLGSIALVFKPRWDSWVVNARHRRLLERHRGRAARDGSTWHVEEGEDEVTARAGARMDEGEERARLLGSCA